MHPEYHWCSILNKRLLIFEENYFFKIFDSFPIYSWSSNTLATWCEELIHWKRPWCWERLRAGGEGGNREWDGWMASLTQWTWVWASSGRWWWTGKPGMQSMGLQRVGHHWVTEQQQQQRNCACLEQPLAGNQELGCLLSSWNDTFLFLSVSSPTLLTHCSGATKHQREVSKRPQTHTRTATSNLCSPVRGQQLLGGKSDMHPDKSNARTILHIIHSSL